MHPYVSMKALPRVLVALLLLLFARPSYAKGRALLPALPPEVASTHFTVTINGQQTPVVHAAANYYLLGFPVTKKPMDIIVTADRDDFWAHGVEVQPWRFGLRPTVQGRTLHFRLRGPAKICITRPHDFLAGAEMLFLFADPPETEVPTGPSPGLRYYGPGVHHENIDAHTGDRIYLAPGAFIFGSLNVWQVKDVRVWGRGTIIYDGPQNPADDDGWMHKPNWHCIVMDNAQDIAIEGLTCIVRSRTWMIQMKDSHGIRYSDIKVIGGSDGNANQDGMDWLGGGDTVVEDSFFRAADDIFAMQGNWDGYDPALMAIPGHDVRNIEIRRSTLSTSISNVVRAAWPGKTFNSGNFSLADSDVLHAGIGGCKVPFALLEIWDDPNGHGTHNDYRLHNVRLEDWYSLLQLRHPSPSLSDVHLDGIFALDQPSLVPSVLAGEVSGVDLRNVTLAGRSVGAAADVPLKTEGGAAQPAVSASDAQFDFTVSPGPYRPGNKMRFTAMATGGKVAKTYEWTFGDGATGHGRSPNHRYSDAGGTNQDGSGRFRVLLHTVTAAGEESWIGHSLTVVTNAMPALSPRPTRPELLVTAGPLGGAAAPSDALTSAPPNAAPPAEVNTTVPVAVAGALTSDARPATTNYTLHFTGLLDVAREDGYTFLLVGNDTASVRIDGKPVTSSPKAWPQVCGLEGNAAQIAEGTVALSAGLHTIDVESTHTLGPDAFAVYWAGSGQAFTPIPASALRHAVTP